MRILAQGPKLALQNQIRVVMQFDHDALKTPDIELDEYPTLYYPSQIQHLDMQTANVLASDLAAVSWGEDLQRKLELVMLPSTNWECTHAPFGHCGPTRKLREEPVPARGPSCRDDAGAGKGLLPSSIKGSIEVYKAFF